MEQDNQAREDVPPPALYPAAPRQGKTKPQEHNARWSWRPTGTGEGTGKGTREGTGEDQEGRRGLPAPLKEQIKANKRWGLKVD